MFFFQISLKVNIPLYIFQSLMSKSSKLLYNQHEKFYRKFE